MAKRKTSADVRTQPESIPAHWPAESHGLVAIKDVRPSPLNPRKTFPDESLEELAASIREHGLLQPLLVRPIGANVDWQDGKWINVDAWELIDGERRYRASKLAKLAEVPIIVRPLNDAQVLELMLVANDQREDVRPSEQAAAYASLAAEIGPEAVATRTGKPISEVRDMIRLAKLPAWCLDAVDDGTLSRSAAAVVARVPGEKARERVAAEALGVWLPGDEWPTGKALEKEVAKALASQIGRDAWTARDAKRFIRARFCRELKSAPFDRKSLTLVPEAGSCDACPKRAGNDPELVADGVREDVCTDTDCYSAKVEAGKVAEMAELLNRGFQPMPEGFDWPAHHGEPPKGWLSLDAKVQGPYYGESGFLRELDEAGCRGKTIRNLLGRDFAPLFACEHGDRVVRLARMADVRKALTANGTLKKAEKPKGEKRVKGGPPPLIDRVDEWQITDRTCLLRAKAAQTMLIQNSESLAAMSANGDSSTDAAYEALHMFCRWFAREVIQNGTNDNHDAVMKVYIPDFDPEYAASDRMANKIDNALAEMTPAELLGFLVMVAANSQEHPVLENDWFTYADVSKDDLVKQAAAELNEPKGAAA